MLKTFDVIMIAAMAGAATVTYQIKHHAENKQEEVHRLENEIRLEQDTIELLKADWALLTQPNRLERITRVYASELKLQPTASTQLAKPVELPMLRDLLPKEDVAGTGDKTTDTIVTGSVKR
ncbi:MAG: cell division protein FtsL [Allorhizobium sp.]